MTASVASRLWATGFRPDVGHLAPLGLRTAEGGIQLDGTTVVRDPRVQLVGYGPSASTIGANRAGRVAARGVLRALTAAPARSTLETTRQRGCVMHAVMLGAATTFAVSTCVGAAVGFTEDVPSEPLGLHVPGTALDHPVARALLATGVSAPWPMPATVLVAAVLARPDRAWTRRAFTVVGTALAAGTLVEPVTWGRRSRRARVLATVPLNLLTAAALVTSARRAGRASAGR